MSRSLLGDLDRCRESRCPVVGFVVVNDVSRFVRVKLVCGTGLVEGWCVVCCDVVGCDVGGCDVGGVGGPNGESCCGGVCG